MFSFRAQQKVFEFNGIRIGGSILENPPVLIGSIFYNGHKIFTDEKKGLFDKDKVLQLIHEVEELSSKTGIPYMFDVVVNYSDAAYNILKFAIDNIKVPFLIDSPGVEITKITMKIIKDFGVVNKVIFNSLTAKTKEEEYEVLSSAGIKAAVALLYTNKIMDMDDRLRNLEIILANASKYGIEKILVDTFVIDLPSLSIAMRAMIEVKNRYGLPVGAGAHNAVSVQEKAFRDRFGRDGYIASELISNMAPIVIGANFILYGPIESSKYVFPATYSIYMSYKRAFERNRNLIISL